MHALEDKDPGIRGRSAELLGDIGDQKVIPRLNQSLSDPNPDVKWKVICALCKLGDEEAISKLVEGLDTPQKPLSYYGSICEALSIAGGEKAINALLNALDSYDCSIFDLAASALGQLRCKKAVPLLLNTWRHRDSLWLQNIPDVFKEIQCKDACSSLADFLLDDTLDTYARLQAANSLGKIGCKDFISTLIITSKDKHPAIREESIEALGNIGFGKPDIFYQALCDENKSVQWAARCALAKAGISDRVVISALIDMLEACEHWEGHYNYLDEFSWAAAEALEYLDGSILPMLQKSILANRDAGTPHLEAVIYVINKIQSRCKYYNYDIYHAHLAAQKGNNSASQSSSAPITHINAEVVQIVEKNYGTIHGQQTP